MSVSTASPAADRQGSSPPPRERILAAARELFYRRGIHAVGVEAIAEAAGTNKMTLYRHFASKDVLVAACLSELTQEFDVAWDAIAAAHVGDPEGQLLAWLRHMCEFKEHEAERGCALANAAVELPDKDHPARRVIREYKTALRERLIGLCRDARLAEPERLADEVFLICRGRPHHRAKCRNRRAFRAARRYARGVGCRSCPTRQKGRIARPKATRPWVVASHFG